MSLPVKVAFLGPEGTYTHQALLQQFGSDAKQVQIFPQGSINACFDQINARQVDYAVVPLENSTNGQVVFTYDLLRDWFISCGSRKAPGFSVVAEQFVAIHHYLFSNAEDLSRVDKLYSHPQVWGQVSEFLRTEKFNGQCSRIDTGSTAQAAEKVFEDATHTSACISSEMSGRLYGLPTKRAEIEDMKGNTTRFLVLGYGQMLHGEAREGTRGETEKAVGPEDSAGGADHCITSLMFVLNDNDPGALCEALDAFKIHRVNLTSIASRPSKVTPWEYVFFVDAEGHENTPEMRDSVRQLQEHCQRVAVLGLFVRSWRYKKHV
ncbi:PDT-domain-containing protein [Metschnikowia bicuspidata var. bicuspidata NRRL YB-4993]|uniref:prephenate dehydratase n=1 Tax=Metschnikowia bicuspidata var. bicuspidata NRRL YB-4993 TaxID=869754 RepID=A0A1A0HI43_9ASCO|nr:PDT-domain-containing protein [Metschnikowia bicuspidata var. bicuspidata NRRL YB-4993]OBA23513.1 PDT-domain-containing protein [Metschnikowia bicuspidata var. bicuspidata NRRL YB-4993]